MDPLIDKLETNEFIKLAIENSYFFSVDIVKKRQSELATLFQNKNQIPARKTTKKDSGASDYAQEEKDGTFYYCDGDNTRILINIDYDGNKEVRRLIKQYTGYSIGAGKTSDFQNYIISHIWGRAFDPRYFTNFWNIVLVPAWANSLLDKKNPSRGSLPSKLQSTIKKICGKLYQNVDKKMDNREPEMPFDENDVVYGTYHVKVLQTKENNERKAPRTKDINITTK